MKRWKTHVGMDLSDGGRWCEWADVEPIIRERDSLKQALETQAPDFKLKAMYAARGQEIEALKVERDALASFAETRRVQIGELMDENERLRTSLDAATKELEVFSACPIDEIRKIVPHIVVSDNPGSLEVWFRKVAARGSE